MNYFRFFIGDYIAKTAELSVAEHGVYCLMLLYYYKTEAPLPRGVELYRLLRCFTKQDRAAVDSVVKKFWVTAKGGLVNPKADDELIKAAKLRARNKENGKKGGRPHAE